MVKVKVLYFGQARDATGTGEEEISLQNPATVQQLFSQVTKLHPKLEKMKGNIRLAVNLELAHENYQVRDGDEVALLPPVVGGSG